MTKFINVNEFRTQEQSSKIDQVREREKKNLYYYF